MLIAGTLDIADVLEELAKTRRIFHSERDLQFAFAWIIRSLDATLRVRLEVVPISGIHLDLSCSRSDNTLRTGIEFKYLTRVWSGVVDGESFSVTHQSSYDSRSYDAVSDIARLERLLGDGFIDNGALIVLTNDRGHWGPRSPEDSTQAAAFRIGHGSRLTGMMDWRPDTPMKTRGSRIKPIEIAGEYVLNWNDFSVVGTDDERGGRFQSLVVEVCERN